QSDGWAVARGTITFPALTEPVFDVALEFDGFRAFSARGRDAAAVTGSVALAGPLAGPTVSGRVVLDDGSVPVNAFTSRDGEELLLYDEGELLALPVGDDGARSEERRVGKECRWRGPRAEGREWRDGSKH